MSRKTIATLVFVLLAFATLTIWADSRWVVALFQCGTFAAALTALGRQPRERLLPPWEALPLLTPALLGLAQLATGSTANRYLTQESILFWTSMACLGLAARVALAEASVRHQFLAASAIFGTAVAGLCLIQAPLRGTDVLGWRVPEFDQLAGPFTNRNTYASLIELLLPAAVWKAVTARKGRWVWWAASIIMPGTVLTTGSRAGSLLVIAELGILLLVQIRAKVLFPLTGVILVVMATGWDTLADRITHEDWSSHRRSIYSSTWELIGEKPGTGHGLGTFIQTYPRLTRFDVGRVVNHAHNDWLEWGAEGGAAMVLPLAGLLAWAAFRARKHIWSWGIAFVLAHSLVDFPLQRQAVGGWFWVYVVTVLAAAANEKTKGGKHRSGNRGRRREAGVMRPSERELAAQESPVLAGPSGQS